MKLINQIPGTNYTESGKMKKEDTEFKKRNHG